MHLHSILGQFEPIEAVEEGNSVEKLQAALRPTLRHVFASLALL